MQKLNSIRDLKPGNLVIASRYMVGNYDSRATSNAADTSNPLYPAVKHPPILVLETSPRFAIVPLDNPEGNVLDWESGLTSLYDEPVYIADKSLSLDEVQKLDREYSMSDGFHGTWGCDPEIFVTDKDDNIVPAFEFLPSEKEIRRGGGLAYWDGFQAEFRMADVPTCLEVLNQYIGMGLYKVWRAATRKNPAYKLAIRDTIPVPPAMLMGADPEHVQFGCKPSRNVYGLAGERIPDPRLLPIRFAGGHIHMGLRNTYPELAAMTSELRQRQIEQVVRALDRTVGLASIALFGELEDVRRRRYYGLAGEYRMPVYGLEYRTLSPYWMLSPAVYFLVFELARLGVGLGMDNEVYSRYQATDTEVIEAIQHSDAELARTIIHRNWQIFERGLIRQFARRWANPYHSKFMTPVKDLKCAIVPAAARTLMFDGILKHFKHDPRDWERIDLAWGITEETQGQGRSHDNFGYAAEHIVKHRTLELR